MTLNESAVEDGILLWFGELGYAFGHGPDMAPGEPAAKRDSFGGVEQVERFRKVIWPPNPATQFPKLAYLRERLRVKLLRGGFERSGGDARPAVRCGGRH